MFHIFFFRIYEEIQKIEANEFHYQEQVMSTNYGYVRS